MASVRCGLLGRHRNTGQRLSRRSAGATPNAAFVWPIARAIALYGRARICVGRGRGARSRVGISAHFRTDHRSLHVLVRYGIPIAIYVELAALGSNFFGDVFIGQPIQLPYYKHFALRYKTLDSENPRLRGYLYAALKSNSGVLEGYENLQVQRGNVRTVEDPDYKGEVYFGKTRKTRFPFSSGPWLE